jgi:hypothetical protein
MACTSHPSRGWYIITVYNHPPLAHPAGKAEPPHIQQPQHAAQRAAVEGEGDIGL